jgi:hypothetical protein
MATIEEIQAELQSRGLTTSTESVLEPKSTTKSEFKKFAESALKGIPSGVIDIVGGWGNLYDYLKGSDDPNAFSSTGIKQAITKLTGVNLQSIPGYRGAYEFTQAGAPAALLTGVGVPGLFSRTPAGVAGEFGVAGSTGLFAQQVAPESPLAQMALQSTPYVLKGGVRQLGNVVTKPEGTFPPVSTAQTLADVGRLTPGELSLSRPQLATEAAVERAPSSGQKPIEFRQAQAGDIESYLSNLFNKASGKTLNIADTTQAVISSFNNYGKSLSSKLRSDARTDFNAAKSAGGMIDTNKLVSSVDSVLQALPVETPSTAGLRNNLQRIIDEYTTVDPVTGQKTVQPISIDRLQKNLSAWGEASYSGKADFGAGNIFEGVAPGQAKGIAKTVLNGYREALDDAIQQGVPGADKLKIARDKFKDNLAKIEQFSNRPLTKAFDVADVTELVPEDVMRDLKNMPPSQRQFLIDVMQNNPNAQVVEVLNSIRRAKFDDVLSSAQVKGGAATDPTFSIKTALTELNKKGSEFADLFPNQTDLNQAKLAMNWMQRVLSSESPQMVGVTGAEAYALGGAAGGSAQVRLALKEAIPFLRELVANPSDFADVIFNPNYRQAMVDLSTSKNLTKKTTDALATLSKGAAILGVRSGAMLETTPPQMPSETQSQPTSEQQGLQEIRDLLKARGYQVE